MLFSTVSISQSRVLYIARAQHVFLELNLILDWESSRKYPRLINMQFLKYTSILKLRSTNPHVVLLHSFVHSFNTLWTPLKISLQDIGRHDWSTAI